jgi:hypothetical protein
VITVAGLQLGALIAFAIVTETVFAWPGVGQLFIQSVQFSDIPVMAAYLLLIGLLFVLINLTVDLLYFVVDPRLCSQGGTARVAGRSPRTTSSSVSLPSRILVLSFCPRIALSRTSLNPAWKI